MEHKPRRAIIPEEPTPTKPASKRPLIIGLVVGAVLIAGGGVTAATLLNRGPSLQAGPEGSGAPCTNAVSVAVDPVHSATAEKIFSHYSADKEHPCVAFKVTELASATAAKNGIGEAKAWIPEDTVWQQRTSDAGASLAQAPVTSMGASPIVVVAPKELTDAVGHPLAGQTLIDLISLKKTFADYGKKDWGTFKLVIPDQESSAIGAAAFRSLVFQVSKGEQLPQAGKMPTENQLNIPQTQYRIVEQPADAAAVVNRLATNKSDATVLTGASPRAGITTESAVLGQPNLKATYLDGGTTAAQVALVNTSDDPLIKDLAAWLDTDTGKQSVVNAGLHRDGQAPSEADRTAVGLPAQAPTIGSPITKDQVEQGLTLSQALGRRLAIMITLDVSGSMGATIPGSQVTRIGLVSQASTFNWDRGAPGFEASFMTFNTTPDGRPQIRQILPFTSNTDPRWAYAGPQLQSALKNVPVGNGTPLFQAIWSAYDATAKHKTSNIRRVVVLTDGKQEAADGAMTEKELLAKMPKNVRDQGVELVLVGLGADADYPALKRVADATGGQAIWVKDIRQYPAVAIQLMS